MNAAQRIPMIDLVSEHTAYQAELRDAIEAVLRHGQFIMGPEVSRFEREAADFLGASFAVSCNSGTDALVLALRANEIGPGDEVVTTPFSFFATAEAVSAVGATPVFADIDGRTFNLDPVAAQGAVNERTKALLPVHLYGQAADLDAFEELARAHDLVLLEDAAQAFGAVFGERRVGAIGECGAFSFFPSKTLGGIGDGGLVVTDNEELADRMRMLRAHGARRRYENETVGYNSRLDTLQAAALLVKLPRLEAATKARQHIAKGYNDRLSGIDQIITPETATGRTHVFHQYTVRILNGRRDAVASALANEGIASMVYYPTPIHRLPAYAHATTFERAERAASEVLSLPISPTLSDACVDEVAAVIRSAVMS
jgi:dTDP-4-amino-4,6-dideoxygalactose transaminase